MPVTSLPPVMQSTDPPREFEIKGDAWMKALTDTWTPQVNALEVNVNAKEISATTQAALATTNGATQVALAAEQVALATTQANLATTNGQTQVALAAQQVTLATTQANLATTNGQTQVTLASQQATTATTQASIAASVANFKGIWGSLSGALNYPASVYLDGLTYRLLVNLPDVTLSNPSTDTAKWSVIDGVVPTAVVGDINSPIYDLPLRNSLTPIVGVGAVTFSRAGAATHINRYGKIIDLVTGVSGYDADGIDLPCASTNILTHSETYTDAAWVKLGVTVTANIIAAPDGTTTASKIVETAVNDMHGLRYAATFVAGTYYTASIFVKKGERDNVRLQLSGGAAMFNGVVAAVGNFNLTTKSFTTNTIPSAASIDELADGWFRLSISALCTTSGAGYYYLLTLDSSGNATFLGILLTGGHCWGAQLEALPFPTPYIKTLASPVSRLGAYLSFPYAENTPGLLYSKTITFDVDAIGTNAAYAKTFSSGDVIFMLSSNTANDKRILVSIGGFSTVSTVIIKDGKFKFSLTYDAVTNIGSLYVDGVKMATMTRTTTATALSMIDINQSATSYIKIKNLRIYDKCFTPEQMRLI